MDEVWVSGLSKVALTGQSVNWLLRLRNCRQFVTSAISLEKTAPCSKHESRDRGVFSNSRILRISLDKIIEERLLKTHINSLLWADCKWNTKKEYQCKSDAAEIFSLKVQFWKFQAKVSNFCEWNPKWMLESRTLQGQQDLVKGNKRPWKLRRLWFASS